MVHLDLNEPNERFLVGIKSASSLALSIASVTVTGASM